LLQSCGGWRQTARVIVSDGGLKPTVQILVLFRLSPAQGRVEKKGQKNRTFQAAFRGHNFYMLPPPHGKHECWLGR
ncbi:MAG: hypothetical protein WB795_13815, partial [Candidatus Acidiferrales bacterium]